MQRHSSKPKPEPKDDLTPEEIADIKEFDIAEAKGETKVYTLKELLEELHK